METNELKPCPFCGENAKHVYSRFTETHTRWCRNCGAESYEFDTEKEAIEAWNTRAERTCTFSVYKTGDDHYPTCSACGYETDWHECEWYFDDTFEYKKNFCPNCGAKVVQDAD